MSFYIIIRGPLGCGKSIISKKLSKILKAKYYAIDKVLEKHNLDHDWEEGYISKKSFLKANQIVSYQAKKILEKKKAVIFDGNFYWKSQIEDLRKQLNFPNYIFTLKASLAVCIERDKARRKSYGAKATQAVYRKSTEFDYGIAVNVNRSLSEIIAEILYHIHCGNPAQELT